MDQILSKVEESVRERPHVSALIDLAALFQGISNFCVAQALLKKLPHLEGVIYFDDAKQELFVLRRGDDVPIAYQPEECKGRPYFAYYDHIHSFGADITLNSQAVAIITFSDKICFYQVLQAAKRMRQLELGQSVEYLIHETAAQQIQSETDAKTLKTMHLFCWSIGYEAKELEGEIIVSTLHKLKHIVKKRLMNISLQLTMDLSICNQKLAHLLTEYEKLSANPFLYTTYHQDTLLQIEQMEYEIQQKRLSEVQIRQLRNDIFVDQIPLDAYETYRCPEQEIEPEAFFRQYIEFYKQKAPTLFGPDNETIDTIIRISCEALPKTIRSTQAQNLEQEVYKQEEKNNQIESHGQLVHQWNAIIEEAWNHRSLFEVGHMGHVEGLYSLDDLFKPYHGNDSLRFYSLDNTWKAMGQSPIFDGNIHVSRNFLVWSSEHWELSLELKLKPVDFFVEYVVSKSDSEDLQYHYLILSVEEADRLIENWPQIVEMMSDTPLTKMIALRKVNGNLVCMGGMLTAAEREFAHNQLCRAQVQLMLFNGQRYYPKNLEEHLINWTKNQTDLVENAVVRINANRKNNRRNEQGNLQAILEKAKNQYLSEGVMNLDQQQWASESSLNLASDLLQEFGFTDI